MTEQELTEIEARANAATPRPWAFRTQVHRELNGEQWGWIEGPQSCRWTWSDKYPGEREDAAFIAHARIDVPNLIAEVRRLRDELRKEYENHAFNDHGW